MRGPWRQNTLTAFAGAIEIGVTTLELDIGVTRDGEVVVNHDRRAGRRLFRDTEPVEPGDPLFPYAGRRIAELTAAQLSTLRFSPAGTGGWAADQGDRQMPTLDAVFSLCRERTDRPVRLNIEAKSNPMRPRDTLGPAAFAAAMTRVIQAHAGVVPSMVSSFDWRVLQYARLYLPDLTLVALAGPGSGSPAWTAGIDVWARPFYGDLAAAASRLGARVLAPNWRAVTGSLIRSARREGIRVVPWTVNRPATMDRLIELGVDGLITDHPARVSNVLIRKGVRSPSPGQI